MTKLTRIYPSVLITACGCQAENDKIDFKINFSACHLDVAIAQSMLFAAVVEHCGKA